MPRISAADLQQGMILAADLKSPQGRLLLPAGTELEKRHLTICKIWGVIEADIQGVEEEEVEKRALDGIDPQRLKNAKNLVARRFAHAGFAHPLLRELARQAVLQIVDRERDTPASPDPTPLDQQPPPPAAEELVCTQNELASLPDIFNRIVEAVNNPRSSATFVADVISKDVGLSAKLLQIVNSPFFGLGQKVDTLSRAVALVGSKQLTTLAMGVSVINQFQDVPEQYLDMQLFWKHSVCCGVWARLLAGQLRLQNEERCFLAGLLHDVGRLVMLKNAPVVSCHALTHMGVQQSFSYAAEQEHFGYDHAALGGMLLENWQLPAALTKAVGGHHAPFQATGPDAGDGAEEACVVHVADLIAHALQHEVGGPLDFVPPLQETAWQQLGLNKNVVAPLVPQAEHQLSEIMRVFFGSYG